LTVLIVSCLVPETIASGILRAGLRHTPSIVAATHVEWLDPVDEGVHVRHLVKSDERFGDILREHGLAAAEVRAWVQAAGDAFDLTSIQSGHGVVLTFEKDQGRLTGCEYEIDQYSVLSMRLQHGQIRARLKAMPQLAAMRGVMGRVESSLATSASAVGVPVQMLSELTDLFGWRVDFETEVRPSDEFRVLYAELRDENGESRPGDILAAEIITGGRTLTAIRFENEAGQSEYYDLDGRALGRPFLRYPLAFGRVTSTYSGSRFHPVLKRRRPHRGIDFAAPTGTPVRAAASGVVTFAGWNGQYGRQVGIRHEAPWATSYSHLRALARGIRPGAQVRKGQVIGYVGRSGMATGPHLHYMVFKNGRYVNPMVAVTALADEQLSGKRWKRFARLRSEFTERLARLSPPIDLQALSLAPPTVANATRSSVASYVN
jgi:murein DD-endopeptidase MepM/ murein hydrolase activator NlpD